MLNTYRQSYQSDLTEQEWKYIRKHLPTPSKKGKRGRPQEWQLREITNALFYLLRTGCQWRMLPHDLPPWQTVYYHYQKWQKLEIWSKINRLLRSSLRCKEGRQPTPSAAIVDAQSVKMTIVKGERGFDGGKKVKGRKRQIIVDTMGFLLAVVVTTANISDQVGAKAVLTRLQEQEEMPRLQKIWADGGYQGTPLVEWVKEAFGWIWEVVERDPEVKGFKVVPRRWVVERTFSWLNNYRRLSKDYEEHPLTSETLIYMAMSRTMLRRLAHSQIHDKA